MTLQARDVSLQLGANAVLDSVSVAVSPGSFAALVGPNGAGKSSLLRVLSGDLAPNRGDVTLEGEPIALFATRDLARLRSVMGQSATIAFDFYVEEVLAMGWLGAAVAYREALRDVVRRCALDGLLGRRFNTLSGGESQRVQFARALLQIWRGGAGPAASARSGAAVPARRQARRRAICCSTSPPRAWTSTTNWRCCAWRARPAPTTSACSRCCTTSTWRRASRTGWRCCTAAPSSPPGRRIPCSPPNA